MCHNGNLLSESNVILHYVQDDKMKANFYFDTASN